MMCRALPDKIQCPAVTFRLGDDELRQAWAPASTGINVIKCFTERRIETVTGEVEEASAGAVVGPTKES